TLSPRQVRDATFSPEENALDAQRDIAPAASLLDLFEGYVAEAKPRPATVAAWKSYLNALIAHVGHDDAARIKEADLQGWQARVRRWVPWICAYTGARVNEITQLRGTDVQKRGEIWTIRITPEAGGTKNNRARIVPLHSHLVEQGFPAVAADVPGPLFYEPK